MYRLHVPQEFFAVVFVNDVSRFNTDIWDAIKKDAEVIFILGDFTNNSIHKLRGDFGLDNFIEIIAFY